MTTPHESRAAKKRQRSSSPDSLGLVLDPASVPVRKRRRCHHPRLELDEDNRLMGSLNGHACPVQLDSGAQLSVVFWSTARRLGLITGTEPTTSLTIDLWIGERTLDVVQLKSVTIDLGSGVQVVTPLTVFPAWLELYYDPDEVTLDAHQLRRGGMVQVFRPGGSDLFVCRPQRLRQRARTTLRYVEPDELMVRHRDGIPNTSCMSVLLDTGATGIHVSASRKKLLLESMSSHTLPGSVDLDIGGGTHLLAQPLEVLQSDTQDFVLGTTILAHYGAVWDHAKHTLDFPGPTGWRRVYTQKPG